MIHKGSRNGSITAFGSVNPEFDRLRDHKLLKQNENHYNVGPHYTGTCVHKYGDHYNR